MPSLHPNEGFAALRFDFAVHDNAGRLKALVEAKRRLGTSSAWAAQVRNNMLTRGQPPGGELFVLVVPDRIYIWKDAEPADARPTYEVDARPLFAPYFERIGVRPEQIEPMAFELLVAWWLEDLAREAGAPSVPELARSGLLGALSGARISREATA